MFFSFVLIKLIIITLQVMNKYVPIADSSVKTTQFSNEIVQKISSDAKVI